jgi:hypothetical protein
LPIADPNIPIATPATPAAPAISKLPPLILRSFIGLAIEVEAACLPNIPAALFY